MMLPLIAMLICPGQTTLEAQACATQNVEQSDAKLSAILGDRTFSAWNKHRDRFCSLAKESLKNGSIHGQVLLGCFEQFNQLLLNEFRSLADPPLKQKEPKVNGCTASSSVSPGTSSMADAWSNRSLAMEAFTCAMPSTMLI